MTTPAPALPSDQNHSQNHHHQAQPSPSKQHHQSQMIGAESTPAAQPAAPTNGLKRATRSPSPRPVVSEQAPQNGHVEPAAKKIRTDEEDHIQEAVQSEGNVSQPQQQTAPVISPPAAPVEPVQRAPSPARAASPTRAISPKRSASPAAQQPAEQPMAISPPKEASPQKADVEMKENVEMKEDTKMDESTASQPPAEASQSSLEASQPPAEAPQSSLEASQPQASQSPSAAPKSSGEKSEKVPATGTYPDCKIYTVPSFGLQNPEEDDALNKEQLKFCGAALRQMKKHKPTIDVFLAPVDPIAMGIPQYPQFVKEPMDVSTIDKKMHNNEYKTAQEFVKDVYLMVNNAIIFNRPDHFVNANAHKLKFWFDGYMGRLPTQVPMRSLGTPKAKLADIDTRPKRDVQPPKDLLTATSPMVGTPNPMKKGGMDKKDQLKFAAQVLKEVMKPKHINVNAIFLEPVDPVALNVPTYFEIIKTPMDLSTVKRKLEHNQYPTLADFESDVRIMINNCLTFNHPQDPVYAMGKEFERLFNKELSKTDAFEAATFTAADAEEESRIKFEAENIERDIAELQAKLGPLKDRLAFFERKRRPSSSAGPSTGKKKSSFSNVHKTPKAHAHHTPAHAKTTSKKAAATRTPYQHPAAHRPAPSTGAHHGAVPKKASGDGSVAPLTLEQKQLLSVAVSRMDETKLARVVEMIKESMPSLFGNSDEIELDIESIDDQTQRNLYDFAVSETGTTKKKNPAASRLEQLSGALIQDKRDRSHYSSGSEDEGSESE